MSKRQRSDQQKEAILPLQQENFPESTEVIQRPPEIIENRIIFPEALVEGRLGLPENLEALNNINTTFNPFYNTIMTNVGVGNDQVFLMKKISSVLDENLILKQHLQIYQRMLEVYMGGADTARNANLLAQMKDAANPFPNNLNNQL